MDEYPKDSSIAHKILKGLPKEFDIFTKIVRNKKIILIFNIFIKFL